MRHLQCTFACALLLVLLAGCAAPSHGDRDLPNLRQVSPALYRAGQPTREGYLRLHEMGVKTILCVRGGDIDSPLIDGLDFGYEQRAMSPWRPRDSDVLWFLRLATDPDRAPLLLHCQHGADRSGYLTAMYRVVVEGWDRQRAIDEMTAHGMGFHDIYQGLINYVRDADVDALRAALQEGEIVQ